MFKANFRTKVLVPVVACMVLLMAVTVFVVNRSIAHQFQTEANNALTTADDGFRYLQSIQSDDLRLRFHGLVNQPVYSAFSTADAPTLQIPLKKLLAAEQDLAIVFYATNVQKVLASEQRDTAVSLDSFAAAARPAVQQALEGQEKVDTVRADGRLYKVISIPVYDIYKALVGALTLGTEINDADAVKFSQLTHSQIVLLAGGRVVASTLSDADANGRLTNIFQGSSSARSDPTPDARRIVVGGIHYFGMAGKFGSLSGDNTLGYVLLSSYEDSLRALQATQARLLEVSSCAILFGALVVWLLVSRVTQPLRELRDSAEAVGRGDLSRRVPVHSKDECGELAVAFNRMTENVQHSRAQLEHTVETLRNTQGQLVQSEKLSAVGEFVAGVAHELNNPLTAVMGFSEMLRDADVDAKYRRQLDLIFKSAQRCSKIVQSLLSFARRHEPERRPVSVNELVEAVLEIVAYPLRTSNIEVSLHLEPKLPVVQADGHQIQQVFLNIVNNARQAMEAHQREGRIKITTEVSGPNVRITFQDNGPGIPEENLRRIFDPFFTTKEVGKGTGLGLSLCYGIIKEHGGSITPASRPGEGATFIIELPAARDAAAATGASSSMKSGKPDPGEGAGKKVLVIDDEEPILEMVQQMLNSYGYHVHTAAEGESALRELKNNRYDAILCDWKMPGLNGRQVYDRLRDIHPELCRRVIFITGDVINEPMQKFLEQEKRPCLTKPFALGELRKAVKTIVAA